MTDTSTTTLITLTSLREQAPAIVAAKEAERKADQEQADKRRIEEYRKRTLDLLKQMGVDTSGATFDDYNVILDGTIFTNSHNAYNYETYLHILAPCPECGELCRSYVMSRREDLIRQLADTTFSPWQHTCAEPEDEEPAKPLPPPPPTLSQRIDMAYDALKDARDARYAASDALQYAKAKLAEAEAAAWKNGQVVGSNDTQRRLCLAELTKEQADWVAACEAPKRMADYQFDLAYYEVERLKLQASLTSEYNNDEEVGF